MRTTLTEGLLEQARETPRRDHRGQLQVVDARHERGPLLHDGEASAHFALDRRAKEDFSEKCVNFTVIMAKVYSTSAGELVLSDFEVCGNPGKLIGMRVAPLPERPPRREKAAAIGKDFDQENFFNRQNPEPPVRGGFIEAGTKRVKEAPAPQKREELGRGREADRDEGQGNLRPKPVPRKIGDVDLTGKIVEKSRLLSHAKGDDKFFKAICEAPGVAFEVTFWHQKSNDLYDQIQTNDELRFRKCIPNPPTHWDRTSLSYSFKEGMSSCEVVRKAAPQGKPEAVVGRPPEVDLRRVLESGLSKIEELPTLPRRTAVSLVARVATVYPLKEPREPNANWKLRVVDLEDETGVVQLKLWNQAAEHSELPVGSQFLFHGFVVQEWGGHIELTSNALSQILELPAAGPADVKIPPIPPKGTALEREPVKLSELGPRYQTFIDSPMRMCYNFAFVGRISFDARSFSYLACPTDGCNKSVRVLAEGLLVCDKCHKEVTEPLRKCRVMVGVPGTPLPWMAVFDEEVFQSLFDFEFGRLLAQAEANEAADGPKLFRAICQKASRFEYRLQVNLKKDYNRGERVNGTVMAAERGRPLEESELLLDERFEGPVERKPVPGNAFKIPGAHAPTRPVQDFDWDWLEGSGDAATD